MSDIVERLRVSRIYVPGAGGTDYDDLGNKTEATGSIEYERQEAADEIVLLRGLVCEPTCAAPQLAADLETAQEEIQRLDNGLQWQPIDTAPKDGTRIICAAFGHSDTWIDGVVVPDETLRVWWACTGSYSEKWGKFWDGLEPSGFANLSHWMPLPEPPEAA